MSAGTFVLRNYETSSPALGGAVMPIQIQPETEALFLGGVANAGSSTPSNLPLRVTVSNGAREHGVRPRRVTVRFTDQGSLPDGYSGDDITLPVLTTAAAAAYIVGVSGQYLGSPVQVVSSGPETFR